MADDKNLDRTLAFLGLLLAGVSSYLPEASKILSFLIVLVSLISFYPMSVRSQNALYADGISDVLTIFEAIRYLCIAWIAVVMCQQLLRNEIIMHGPELITKTVSSMKEDSDNGRRTDASVVSINRISQLTGSTSYVVQIRSKTGAVAAPLPSLLKEVTVNEAKWYENILLIVGAAIAGFSWLIRCIYRMLNAVAK